MRASTELTRRMACSSCRASACYFAAESDFWIELEDVVRASSSCLQPAMAAEASKVARGRLALPAQTSISAAGRRIRGGRWHGESATALDLAPPRSLSAASAGRRYRVGDYHGQCGAWRLAIDCRESAICRPIRRGAGLMPRLRLPGLGKP